MTTRRVARAADRAGAIALGAAAGVLALTAPALGHVTVSSQDAVQGGYGKLTFRVPNEKDDASTTKLEIVVPAEAALPSASVQQHPGWSVSVQRTKAAKPIKVHGAEVTEVVSRITWTARSGHGIKPGEFDEFSISCGPLPRTSQLTFKALQTYSDGSVVKWIETAAPGAAEPEHPAPVLKLAAPPGQQPSSSRPSGTAKAEARGDGVVPAGALSLSVLALAASGFAVVRTRVRG
ncbi:MAG: YcnI family protein [Actinomadura rubrobrunea]|nr:YcnI family protein [Actinomadura rubrobrunea]